MYEQMTLPSEMLTTCATIRRINRVVSGSRDLGEFSIDPTSAHFCSRWANAKVGLASKQWAYMRQTA